MPHKIHDIQPLADRRIRGFHLDTPTTGLSDPGNKVHLSGWVVSFDEAISHLEIREHGQDTSCTIHSYPLNIERPDVVEHFQDGAIDAMCGFSTNLMALGLPENALLSIHAISESEDDIPLCRLSLKRTPTRTNFCPKLQPIIITTLGRTGSTWLMQLLAKHPSIIVAKQHPYETFALEYWLHLVSQQLLAPHSALSPVDQQRFDRDFLCDQQRQSWFHNEYYLHALEFCQQAIEDYYLSVGREQNTASATFFAEKIPYFSGDGSTTWRQLGSAVRELYPNAKEIVLVRDFRDMILSALHFGAKDKDPSDIEKQKPTACHNVTKEVNEFSAYYKLHRANTLLVRYEDLLLNTTSTLREIFTSLGISSDEDILQTITRNKHLVAKPHQQHITSKSIEKSVQRWKYELTPRLQGEYTDMFRYDLNLFGYDS